MFGALKTAFQNSLPDILIVDRFTFAGFDVAEYLGIPFVINNPQLLLDIDDPPMHVPAPYFGMHPETDSIFERCLNPLQRWKFRVIMIETFRRVNANRMEMANLPAIQSRHQLYGDKLVLSNTAFGFEYPRPMLPQFQMTGPLLPLHPEPISSNLLRWMTIEEVGRAIVLVNLGHSVEIADWQARALVRGLNSTGHRVLWVLPNGQWSKVEPQIDPHMFFLASSIPQLSVLRDQRVQIFVTTGGLTGTQEALINGKPVLCLPFSPGQREVASRVVRLGAGISINVDNYSEEMEDAFSEEIFASIKVLHNTLSYKENALHVGHILR